MPDRPTPDTILQDALELTDSQERAAYLDEACGKDAALRDEMASLLAAHLEADAFMDTLADPVWQETASEKEGDRIGRYKLLQQIGEGGFGTVYLAEQTEPVKRRVALKVIKAGMDSKEVIARFEAERQALALMDHPNIAKVHDAGTTEGGRPYFVMELVKGVPLTNYCADKELETRERLELFVDVCAAVQHAHQKGIIHRDLKPSNILVSPHDGKPVVKVIDFGIAKAISMELTDKTVFTQLGRMIGTPQYMSPEQAELNALDVDTRSDIYSLGVVLYELLTGSTPLDGEQLRSAAYGEMQRLIREETPPKPSTRVSTVARQVSTSHPPDSRSLRGDLDWIVMKALEKERERRYETANALAQDIGRHLRNEPVVAGPPSAGYRFGKFAKRNKVAIGVSAAMVFLLSAGIATTSWQAVRATKARDEAVVAQKDAEAIAEFLTGMFESSRPGEEKGGRDVKVRDILDRAAADLESNTAMPAERRARLQATLGVTYGELGLYDETIPLQEKVRNYYLATSGLEHPDTLDAMNNLAISCFRAGRLDEALEMQEEVLALRHKVLGPEHPETLRAMHNLAVSYYDAGRKDEALKLREQVLALHRKVLGPEHPETLRAMHNLASSYSDAGSKDEALKLREQVLALCRKVLGPEHPETLMATNNLAASYFDAGHKDEALKMQEEVLPLYRKVLGPEHPETLVAMTGLANSYFDVGRKDEALKLRKEVLALSRKLLGDEHPDTLMAMGSLARSSSAAGRRDEALKLREEVLALSRKVLGPEHPATLIAMNGLANSYFDAGRKDEALEMQEEVLPLFRKVNGPEHPATLGAMYNLANSYFRAGRLDEALEMQNEVLALRRKVLGPEHPDTLDAMHNLAVSYDDAGRKDEALKLREEVLPLYRKVLGPERPETLMAMNSLAVSYFAAGRRDEALKLREEVLALFRKVLGPEHPSTLDAMHNLATSSFAAGRKDEALKLREQVLALRRKVLGPEHPDTLDAMNNLAVSYAHVDRRDEALKIQEEVLALYRKVLGPEHPNTLSAMNNLAVSYFDAGRRDEALKLREEVLPLYRKARGPEHPNTLNAVNNLAASLLNARKLPEAAGLLSEHAEFLLRAGNGPENEVQIDLHDKLTLMARELSKGPVEDEVIDRYYAANKESFRECGLELSTITFPLENNKEARTAQREKVQALHDMIANGKESFAAVAREHSKDPYAVDGGSNGKKERGDLNEPLNGFVFAMKNRELAIHDDGKFLRILKVENRVVGEIAPLAKVREEVSVILQKQKADALLQQWQEEARAKVDAWEKENKRLGGTAGVAGETAIPETQGGEK